MDQSVIDSLKKWPNVPLCFGWLALDRRGDWRMRNEFAQEHHLPGDIIRHEALKVFIERNYARDALGRFFFQNGPQRVHISLDYTPWVLRLLPSQNTTWKLKTTQGHDIIPLGCLIDELGNVLIEADFPIFQESATSETGFESIKLRSIALLHHHDLEIFSGMSTIQINACNFGGHFGWMGQKIPIEQIYSQDIAARFKFNPKPASH